MILLGNGLGKIFGIRPRRLIGLLGIPFSPLIHRDIAHLVANTVPFLVLGWFILVQGELAGSSGLLYNYGYDSADWWIWHLAVWARCDPLGRKRANFWLYRIFAD